MVGLKSISIFIILLSFNSVKTQVAFGAFEDEGRDFGELKSRLRDCYKN